MKKNLYGLLLAALSLVLVAMLTVTALAAAYPGAYFDKSGNSAVSGNELWIAHTANASDMSDLLDENENVLRSKFTSKLEDNEILFGLGSLEEYLEVSSSNSNLPCYIDYKFGAEYAGRTVYARRFTTNSDWNIENIAKAAATVGDDGWAKFEFSQETLAGADGRPAEFKLVFMTSMLDNSQKLIREEKVVQYELVPAERIVEEEPAVEENPETGLKLFR